MHTEFARCIETGIENAFSGVAGFGSGILDDMGISIYNNIQNPIARGIAKTAITAGGEAAEEMSAEVLDVGAKKITYDPKATVKVSDVLYAGALGALISAPGALTSGYGEYSMTKSTYNTVNSIIEAAGKASNQIEASAAVTFLESSAEAAADMAKEIDAIGPNGISEKYGVSESDFETLRRDAVIMNNELTRAAQAMSDKWQNINEQNGENAVTEGIKGETLENSNIVLEKDENSYPYNEQEVIDGYEDAVDEDIIDYINDVRAMKNPNYANKRIYTIGRVSDRFNSEVRRLTNTNFSGNDFVLRGSTVNHIDNRHGKTGVADHSMANDNDLGRMGWVLDNYDSMELVYDKNGDPELDFENKNSDGSPSPVVKVSKKINGTYFVVEAVPVSSANSAFIKSAYISKNSTDETTAELLTVSDQDLQHLLDTENLSRANNRDPGQSADTTISIPQTDDGVKSENVDTSANAYETLDVRTLTSKPTSDFGKVSAKQIDALRKVSRAVGAGIVLEKGSAGYDGYYDPSTRTLHINADSVKPMNTVIRHEVVHMLKREAPKEFEIFKNFVVLKYRAKYGEDAFNAYIANKKAQYKQKKNRDISDDLAIEELCADIGMDMLASAYHVREFVIKHKSAAEKLYDCMKRVIHAIGRALGIDNIDSYSVFEAYTALANAANMNEIEVDERAQIRRTYDIGFTAEADAALSSLPGQLSLSDFAEASRLLGNALESLENAQTKTKNALPGIRNSNMTAEEKRAAFMKAYENNLKAEMDARDEKPYSFDQADITTDDINTLRSIGRKSINDFTSEDLKKAEPFARRAWRELGTKSPFFRAWFGDWRANDNTPLSIPKINPASVISSGKEFNHDMNRTISWSKDAAKESILNAPHNVKDEIAVIGANMSEIVRTAVLLDTWVSNNPSKRKMDGSAFMHSLYTVVPLDNKKILIKLFAEEALSNDNSTVFTRAYSLKYIEKVAEIDNGVHSESGGLTDSHSTTINSISDLFDIVKRYDTEFKPKPASKVVNDDGTPMVVYHGTSDKFTEFKYSELREREGSFFFAQNKEDAQAYSGNGYTMPVYVNLKKPIDYNNLPSEISRLATKREQVEALKKLGYDGWMCDLDTGWGEISAFYPEQIKSATDNIGTFNNENPDIMYSFSDANSVIDPDAESELFSVPDISAELFSAQIDNWLSGNMKSSDLFEIGNTPAVLKALGASDLPVVMSQDVMAKITGEKHNIALDEIKQLPYAIANPIMVFKSATVDNAYIILTELTDKSGNDVVVAMHLNRMSGFNRINRISSVYGKYNIGNFVSSQIDASNLKYADKKKSQEWLRSRGLQLPKLNTVLDSTDSILQKKDIVNMYFTQNAENYSLDPDIMYSFNDILTEDNKTTAIPEQTIVYIGSYRSLIKNDTFKKLFKAGKEGDIESARLLAETFVTDDFVRKFNSKYKDVTIIPLLGEDSTTTNVVPQSVALYIAAKTGNAYYDGICKTSKNDFKHKSSKGRLSSSVDFTFKNSSADAIRDKHFVIFDDCITTGTTVNALRDFIEGHGGIVDGFSALVKGIDHTDNMAISEEQLDELAKLMGDKYKKVFSRLTARQAKVLLKDENLRKKLYLDDSDTGRFAHVDSEKDSRYNIGNNMSESETDNDTERNNVTGALRVPEITRNKGRWNQSNRRDLPSRDSEAEIPLNVIKTNGIEKRPQKSSDRPMASDVGSFFNDGTYTRSEANSRRFREALESGDYTKARSLLDEQAVRNGYTPVKVYHGTRSETVFTVFNNSTSIWVSTIFDRADGFTENNYGNDPLADQLFTSSNSGVYDLYARLGNTLDVGNVDTEIETFAELFEFADKIGFSKQEIKTVWNNRIMPESHEIWTMTITPEFAEIARNHGYDSLSAIEGDNVRTYGILYPENVKSAKLETFDDEGNLIPLEERFNSDDDDIRYSFSNDYIPQGENPTKDDSEKKIAVGMSDSERYDILKDKEIELVHYDKEKLDKLKKENDDKIDFNSLKKSSFNNAKRILRILGNKFEIFKEYYNSDIDVTFEYSNTKFGESIRKQGKNYDIFAQMLTIIDDIATGAVAIEAHKERYDNPDSNIDNVYVLVSAFVSENGIVPVRLNIKTFSDKTANKLHMIVSSETIQVDKKEDSRLHVPPDQTDLTDSNARAISTISIADLFAKVNTSDGSFLKYIPDQFLSAEQIESKNQAIKNEKEYVARKNAEKYGSINYSFSNDYIPQGETPARDVAVPAHDDGGRPISRSVRTILEADATPDTFVPGVLREVREGRFSYEVITDKNAADRAREYIEKRGYVSALKELLGQFERSSLLDKYDIAILQTLYNDSAAHLEFLSLRDSDGVTYIDKLLSALVYTGRVSGQNLQAQRLLKKMTPMGLLLDAKRLVDDMNREIDTALGDFVEEENRRIIDSKSGNKNVKSSRRYHKKQKPLKINEELEKRLLSAKTIDGAMNVRDQILEDLGSQVLGTVSDKLRAYRYFAMLFNPRTHIRNVIGNSVNALQIEISDFVSAVMQKAVRDPKLRTKTIVGMNRERRSEYENMKQFAHGLFER